MATTVSYERTGLDTGTGNRSAARMAGRMTPDSGPGSIVNPVANAQTVEQLFQGMITKQKEDERVATAAQKARDAYMSGEPAPLNSAGSQTIVDVNAAKTLDNTAKTLSVANQGYANREAINLESERAKKASGLGTYNGIPASGAGSSTGGGAYRTDSSSNLNWLAGMAADDNARNASLMSQKAANATQSQIDANRAVGIDNAYSQRYAAAQAADAQKTAAAYQMIGQFANQGQYKYWGG